MPSDPNRSVRVTPDARIKKLVLDAREILKNELCMTTDEGEMEGDDHKLVEDAESALENEPFNTHVTEHLCYLRGLADAFDLTIVELFDACMTA